MSNPTDKQPPSRQNKEVVTVKDVTTSKYDAMTASLESLTEVTVRAAEASKGSIGAIEAMGDQNKASIEEMGKSVTENICGALAATMQEVLTQVLRNREPPASTVMGRHWQHQPQRGRRPRREATTASKEELPRGGAGAGRTAAVERREEEEAEKKPSGGGGEAGAARVLTATGGAPGSSSMLRSRVG
ncbi:unnamed protein product [Linum trigynum]|uniref:Uncharacterized protein n=1 Tax=Linum trigynum TaxID=586398 RepID=A0AAV2GJZ5_9ROSI